MCFASCTSLFILTFLNDNLLYTTYYNYRLLSGMLFSVEDKNENCVRTPSRDVSVDEETQINAKIINLIENEMKRDNNKHTHFSDSRPQSLSFYEDEKIPEELSGNLELLSPEERKHYRRRKEYIDLDLERNVYNNMQVHFCQYNRTFPNM